VGALLLSAISAARPPSASCLVKLLILPLVFSSSSLFSSAHVVLIFPQPVWLDAGCSYIFQLLWRDVACSSFFVFHEHAPQATALAAQDPMFGVVGSPSNDP